MQNIKYQNAVEFLKSLNNIPSYDYMKKTRRSFDRSFFVERLAYFLKLIGNPQDKVKYIHVTGTAGKGSTTAAIHNVLKRGGYKVGSYYSPHTTTSIERIKVNNEYISPNDFANIVEGFKKPLTECAIKSPYGVPSYFEVFVAIGFVYFAKEKCDWVVLEVGLGGLNDATNVIKNTKYAVITNIDYDHQDVLGNTLELIAKEKMGIVKKHCTLITTEERPRILKMFKNKCEKENAKFLSINVKNLSSNDKNGTIARKIGELLNIKKKLVERGIKQTKLPCRFETIQESPHVIIDGAHNRIKIKKLVEDLKTIKYRKLVVLYGMVADKNVAQSLDEIAHLADHIIFTRSLTLNAGRKSASMLEFKKIMQKYKRRPKIDYFLDPWQALEFSLSQTESADCLAITGSMYLTGNLREKWIDENYILKNRKSF